MPLFYFFKYLINHHPIASQQYLRRSFVFSILCLAKLLKPSLQWLFLPFSSFQAAFQAEIRMTLPSLRWLLMSVANQQCRQYRLQGHQPENSLVRLLHKNQPKPPLLQNRSRASPLLSNLPLHPHQHPLPRQLSSNKHSSLRSKDSRLLRLLLMAKVFLL